jgi:hypothetical protein
MAYWMIVCTIYLYIVIFGANIRICRESVVGSRPYRLGGLVHARIAGSGFGVVLGRWLALPDDLDLALLV